MLVQNKIFTTIVNAKYYSGILLNKITEQEIGGEDCIGLKHKFTILGNWILILEDYLDNNFDSNGNLIPATFDCLTQQEAADLVAKVNLLVGDNTLPENNDWVLSMAYWNDNGFWRDNGPWHDTLPII